MSKLQKRKRKLWIALGIQLMILGLIIGGGMYTVDHYLDKINKVDPEDEYVIPPEMEDFETDGGEEWTDEEWSDEEWMNGEWPDDVTSEEPDTSSVPGSTSSANSSSTKPSSSKAPASSTPAVKYDDSGLLNILLVGQDRRPGEGRQRSDSMILCSINTKTKQVSMISFLRDMYVVIPGGYSNNRINAAYKFGGFKLLDNTLNYNFGVTVDGNFEVDFDGFRKVINRLGGVDIQITAAEAKYMGINDGKAGTVHMTGDTALTYSRIRKIDDDFNRTRRQRTVLMAVFNKMKRLSVGEILDLANEILPMLTTDMSNSEIVSLMTQLAPMVSSMSVGTYSIPASGTYYNTTIRGMAVLVPNLSKCRTLLRDQYLPFS